MKTSQKIALMSKKISFKLFILFFLFFAVQKGNSQFVITPGTLSSTSTNPLTINGVVVAKGGGVGNANIAIGNTGGAGTTLSGASTGTFNNAVGFFALANVTASILNNNENNAFGTSVMRRMLSGTGNTAVGSAVMQYFRTCSSNTAVGVQALQGIVGGADTGTSFGNSNSALGAQALMRITSGSGNVGVGGSAGDYVSSGSNNILIGLTAGRDLAGSNALTSGNNNIAIGVRSQLANPTGDFQLNIQNIIYGTGNSGFDAVVSTGRIGIGVPSPVTKLDIAGDLRIQTVNTGSTTGQYLYVDGPTGGIVRRANLPAAGVGSYCSTVNRIPVTINVNGSMGCSNITDNGTTVQVSGGASGTVTWNGTSGGEVSSGGFNSTPGFYHNTSGPYSIFTTGMVGALGYIATSDERLKKNIKKIESPLDKISKLSGYTYNWNKDYKAKRVLDDSRQAGFLAQEVEKVLPEAVVINDDGIYGLNYNAIMPLLAEGIKEQEKTINELKIEIAELKSQLNQKNNTGFQTNTNTDYFQIQPNPVENESKIVFKIENTTAKSIFVIYDLQGKMLKQIDLPKNTKEGQVTLNKKDLVKGMYILSLIVNNNEVQSKRFLVL